MIFVKSTVAILLSGAAIAAMYIYWPKSDVVVIPEVTMTPTPSAPTPIPMPSSVPAPMPAPAPIPETERYQKAESQPVETFIPLGILAVAIMGLKTISE